MKELVCIVCPRGCRLSVGEGPEFPVSGNGCDRGRVYGRSEAVAPTRIVTATCAAGFPGEGSMPRGDFPRRVPVRTVGGVPKDRVRELAAYLSGLTVPLPVRAGDCIVPDWDGTGIVVVATRDIGFDLTNPES